MTNPFKKVGSFITDELLGVDDIKRAVSKASKGDFAGAAKSAGTALFEAGTTIASGVAAVPTGGASVAAKGAQVAAKQAAKQGVKQITKETAESVAKSKVISGAAKSTPDAIKAVPRQWAEAAPRPATVGRGGGVSVQVKPKAPARPNTTPGYPLNPAQRPTPGGYPKPGHSTDFDPWSPGRSPIPSPRPIPYPERPRPNVPSVPKPEPVKPKATPKTKQPTAIGLPGLPRMGKPGEIKPETPAKVETKPTTKTENKTAPKVSRVAKIATAVGVATLAVPPLLPKKKEEGNGTFNPSSVV